MAITFRDFAPSYVNKVLGIAIGGRQTLETLLQAVNGWIERGAINVINVETVILPEGAADAPARSELDETRYSLGAFEIGPTRLQVIRVWYRQ
jgi:hypothetical protein